MNIGAKHELTNWLAVSGNWGEAFKLPSFFALGHPLVGNPQLQPETAESWDLGLQWMPGDAFEVDAHYFSNAYENLIDFDPELFTNINRKQVDTSGVELKVSWSPQTSVRMDGYATYTDIDAKETSEKLTGRPKWVAGGTVIWEIKTGWRAVIGYHWSAEQYAASRHTGETVTELIDDYHRLDMNISWQPTESFSIGFAVDNLLDEQYYSAIGFPGIGRNARISIAVAH
jgi:outer membrane receptor protein involved in Fe transport